jgi:hypothetical protein
MMLARSFESTREASYNLKGRYPATITSHLNRPWGKAVQIRDQTDVVLRVL